MISRAIHRLLLGLLPRGFRDRCGADMHEVFLEALESARGRGFGAAASLWSREAFDVALTGHRLRRDARRYGAEFVARGVGRRWTTRRRGMTMGVMDDVRYAIRSLARRPSLTLFAVMTIGLGLGATTAMFGTVESVVLNPLPFAKGDRMVGLFRQIGQAQAFITPRSEDLVAWREQNDLLEALEPWTGRSMTITGRGEAREIEAALVGPGYAEMVGWSPEVGRMFTESDAAEVDGKVLLASYGFAMRTFGSAAAAVGETLQLDGDVWTVIGVVPAGVLLPGWGLRAVDVWRPITAAEAGGAMPALGILREGVTAEQLNARFAELASASESTNAGYASLVRDQVAQGIRGYLGLLMGAVVLLLLIACVNVSNLLLFRANARRRETAVRAALGGGRGRLLRQMLLESLMLASMGGAVGVVVSLVGQAAILGLRPPQLEVLDYVSFNGRVWAFAFVITLVAGLVFGLLPALQASRPNALEPLRSGLRTEGDVIGRRMRWLLVSGEVGLSFALLLGCVGVFSTLIERQRIDPGFRADEIAVATVTAPSWRYGEEAAGQVEPLFESILDRLSRLPGVVHATRASGAPTRAGVLIGRVQIEGDDPLEDTQVLHGPFIRTGYFETLGQEVVRGRAYTSDDLETEEGLIILGEETARRLLGDREPVGARLRMVGEDEWTTVGGVAADVVMTGLGATNRPLQVYHPQRETGASGAFVVRVATGADPRELLPLIREVIESADREVRIEALATGTTLLRDTLDRERFATTIMATFATLALLLAAVGLYGVVSQVVGQRVREIGIRIALGARRQAIASMVLRRAGGATLVGVIAGLGLAWIGGQVLDSQIYGFEAFDLPTYAGSALALGLTALLAAYAPARRASRVDPVEAMRTE